MPRVGRGRGLVAGVLALLGLVWACSPTPAIAAGTVSVSTTAALLQALNGGGRVQVTTSDTLTVDLPIVIAADTILEGVGSGGRTVTISGGGNFRVFRVLPGVRFEVRGITIRDGRANRGGAILNEGVLVADRVVFTACQAAGMNGTNGIEGTVRFGFGTAGTPGTAGLAAEGGAVFNLGEATFQQCTFLVNEAKGGDGGAGGNGGAGVTRTGEGGAGGAGATSFGGAIANVGQLSVTNCLFSGNVARAGVGGAGGTGNGILGAGQGGRGADAGGGAIHNLGFVFLTASSFTTNLVIAGSSANAGATTVNIGKNGANGGAGYGGAFSSWSTSVVVNTTFYTNLVSGGKGGGGAAGTSVFGDGGDGGAALGGAIHVRGVLSLTNVTVAWNGVGGGEKGAGAGGIGGPDGVVGASKGGAMAADAGAVVAAINSIFATAAGSSIANLDGPFRDDGFNLFNDAGPTPLGPGSRKNLDPQLGGFAVWTLGTPGLLPIAGSPAIDSASAEAAPGVDQRGIARPTGRGPEIGAMEVPSNAFLVGGRVLNGTDGVPGVVVTMGANHVVTDDAGHFEFPRVPSGSYSVELPNDGLGYTPRIHQFFLAIDQPNLVFRLAPFSLTISRQTAAGWYTIQGVGLPGVTYVLEGTPNFEGWQPLSTGTADTQGRLTFEQAPINADARYYRLRRD